MKTKNESILKKLEENKLNKKVKIIEELKKVYPLEDRLLLELYNKSISIHQSNNQCNGEFLENDIIAKELETNNISFKRQVVINKEGEIFSFTRNKEKCFHNIDFVIGDDINIGDNISKFKVLSCKTTCRERWTQDCWSLNLKPQKYILLTISNDYPPSTRFNESNCRKI